MHHEVGAVIVDVLVFLLLENRNLRPAVVPLIQSTLNEGSLRSNLLDVTYLLLIAAAAGFDKNEPSVVCLHLIGY